MSERESLERANAELAHHSAEACRAARLFIAAYGRPVKIGARREWRSVKPDPRDLMPTPKPPHMEGEDD